MTIATPATEVDHAEKETSRALVRNVLNELLQERRPTFWERTLSTKTDPVGELLDDLGEVLSRQKMNLVDCVSGVLQIETQDKNRWVTLNRHPTNRKIWSIVLGERKAPMLNGGETSEQDQLAKTDCNKQLLKLALATLQKLKRAGLDFEKATIRLAGRQDVNKYRVFLEKLGAIIGKTENDEVVMEFSFSIIKRDVQITLLAIRLFPLNVCRAWRKLKKVRRDVSTVICSEDFQMGQSPGKAIKTLLQAVWRGKQ